MERDSSLKRKVSSSLSSSLHRASHFSPSRGRRKQTKGNNIAQRTSVACMFLLVIGRNPLSSISLLTASQSDTVLPPPPPTNGERNQTVAPAYCRQVQCMQHEADVDAVFLPDKTFNSRTSKRCRLLWFVALHESDEMCHGFGKTHSYNIDYSIALQSVLANAPDALQPVLILGRLGTDAPNSIEHKKFGKWAQKRGVKVIYSPRLSFQDDVIRGRLDLFNNKIYSRLQGPFLRLDIPKFIREHKLFDMANVCPDHVLYTDSDVIFANPFTQEDVQILKNAIGDGMLSYGRQLPKTAGVVNTGVMMIHVERFERELPQILDMARKSGAKYPVHDQDMLNRYQDVVRARGDDQMFRLLPMRYNWKAYWRLEPSRFSDVKILHFHGPKRGGGLEAMATRNITGVVPAVYRGLLEQGVCCDQGRTAAWSLEAMEKLEAPHKDLC